MPNDEVQVNAKLTKSHSIEMLKAVIDGQTYSSVARSFGVTRTAVERRVKDTIRQLIDRVGIEGLAIQQSGYVHRIRKHRNAILMALTHFEPPEPYGPRAMGRVLSETELLEALKRISSRSSWPNRDQTMFYILFVTGARPLEIARLRVSDYLHSDGSVRTHSEVRSQVAITGKSRPLYFTNTKLDQLMAEYLNERCAQRSIVEHEGLQVGEMVGTAISGGPSNEICSAENSQVDRLQKHGVSVYRGLDPNSPLFVTSQGEGFKIFEYGVNGQCRFLCRPILELYRKIFRQAELAGLSPLTVRQTVAARLYERGADEEQVGLLLGLSDKASVKEQFPRPKRRIQDLVRD